jgi:hypothetical protein
VEIQGASAGEVNSVESRMWRVSFPYLSIASKLESITTICREELEPSFTIYLRWLLKSRREYLSLQSLQTTLVPFENLILSCSQSDIVKSFTKTFCYQSWRISASSVRHHDHAYLSQCEQSKRLICSHLVYFNDVPVGTICCRLETKDGQTKLYLMTMGILAVSTVVLIEVFKAESKCHKSPTGIDG